MSISYEHGFCNIKVQKIDDDFQSIKQIHFYYIILYHIIYLYSLTKVFFLLICITQTRSASGCPGSHVVIRCHDHNLDDAVVMDAAALAARQSKCNGNVIKVSMTRARDVKKPSGAKAGLVQLTGQVRTVVVNMKEAQALLDRLDETVLIN